MMDIGPNQNVLWSHFDIEVLWIDAWRREFKAKRVILFREFDSRFPYQLSFCLHPILEIFSKKAAVGRENIVRAAHDAVTHPVDFVEDGFTPSNWN
jgi:hypothetical protein